MVTADYTDVVDAPPATTLAKDTGASILGCFLMSVSDVVAMEVSSASASNIAERPYESSVPSALASEEYGSLLLRPNREEMFGSLENGDVSNSVVGIDSTIVFQFWNNHFIALAKFDLSTRRRHSPMSFFSEGTIP